MYILLYYMSNIACAVHIPNFNLHAPTNHLLIMFVTCPLALRFAYDIQRIY